jgi:hypothetical protein
MRPGPSSAIFCPLFLLLSLGSAAAAAFAPEPQQAAALWLSRQLHRPVEASQILVSPPGTALEGCTITRARRASIGATALSLRCPALALPHLVLLHLSIDAAASAGGISENPLLSASRNKPPHHPSHDSPHGLAVKVPPIVRAGAALRADWRTASLHAQLPVVALDAGVSGAEIRVRIVNTNRVLRARILSAQDVTILVAGV